MAARNGILGRLSGSHDETGIRLEADKEMLLRVVRSMLRPYLTTVLATLGRPELLPDIEKVHEGLLLKFWHLSQTDMQIGMAMVPVMAYVKKADKRDSIRT